MVGAAAPLSTDLQHLRELEREGAGAVVLHSLFLEQIARDWQEFRERQTAGAEDSVRSTLVLDEIARREKIEATEEDVDQEIAKFAERSGRAPAAVRARLEKEDGVDRIRVGIQREKTMTWLLDKAAIVEG